LNAFAGGKERKEKEALEGGEAVRFFSHRSMVGTPRKKKKKRKKWEKSEGKERSEKESSNLFLCPGEKKKKEKKGKKRV